MGLAILLWGTSAVIGQDDFRFVPSDPCAPLIHLCSVNSCGNGNGGLFTPFTFGGWVEMGVYANSHGNRDNGPMYVSSHRRTDFQMNQFYLFAEKEMNTRRGFDWGARADLVYGTDVDAMWSFGDQTFDYGWGMNRHGYGMSAYQLYGTLGYKDLNIKIGKFIGYVGWEEAGSKNNHFYSHSYCYWIEPATHSGVLATYALSDRFSVSAGWTAGADTSFHNRFNDNAILTGFNLSLSDRATVYYWINAGRENNGWHRGDFRFYDPTISHNDYFIQSVVLERALSDRFTHVLQYNLRNDNFAHAGGTKSRLSAYGINNHFLYQLTNRLTAGTRVEWLRDNGGYFVEDTSANYWQVTLGLRWDVTDHLSFRPEVRYDWSRGATPFAPVGGVGTRSHQVSGGGGMVVSF